MTGASTGLGRAIAVGAAQSGAQAVIVNYANSAEQAHITAGLVRDAGAQAIIAQGDVGSSEDCARIVDAARSFGRIDALFNNAGVSRAGAFDEFTDRDFLDVYRVNVVGAYQMAITARDLLEAGAGAIVNTSSLAGVAAKGSSLAYTVSKGALNTLGRALALDLAPKIRVKTICPGFIDTEWFDKNDPVGGVDALREHIRAASALKTISRAEDIADSALFLGSHAARHITGQVLVVDAGMHLGG